MLQPSPVIFFSLQEFTLASLKNRSARKKITLIFLHLRLFLSPLILSVSLYIGFELTFLLTFENYCATSF